MSSQLQASNSMLPHRQRRTGYQGDGRDVTQVDGHSKLDNGQKSNVHKCYDADDPAKHLLAHVATTAFDSDQQGDAPKCHPDTRTAVLEEIMNWIASAVIQSQFMLWLNGAAGAGKSAIARSIVELCLRDKIALARFFFFRTDYTRNTVTPLVATLAHQLIQCLPDLEAIIIPRIQSDPLIFNKSLSTQFQYLIFEPLLELKHASRSTKTVLLLFDGVDECAGDHNQTNIIRIVSSFVRTQKYPLIAFFGSRAEHQLKEVFRSPLVYDLLLQLPLDHNYLPDKDIRLFLDDNFRRIKQTHSFRHYLDYVWPSPGIVQEIVDKSSGQFIYASVVVKFVSTARCHPGRQLEIVRGLRPAGLSTPFAQLDTLYRYIFSQVQDIDAALLILAVRILERKSSVSECAQAVALSVADATFALMDLSSVIEIDNISDETTIQGPTITFLHASLPDFLVDKARSGEYCVNTPEILAYLSKDNVRHISQWQTSRLPPVPKLVVGHAGAAYHQDYTAAGHGPSTVLDRKREPHQYHDLGSTGNAVDALTMARQESSNSDTSPGTVLGIVSAPKDFNSIATDSSPSAGFSKLLRRMFKSKT